MRRRHLFWPVVLIIVGSIWLLDNLNIIRINIWSIIVPVVLIVLGISILLGSVASRRPSETESLSIPLEGAERARLHLNYGAGRVSLKAGARSSELLSGVFGDGVQHRAKHKEAVLDVTLDMPAMIVDFPFHWSAEQRQWTVALNSGVPLELAFDIGAAETQIDLTELRVVRLDLHTGASATDLRLPVNAGFTHVNVEAGAASINIHVPQGVAARIRSDSAISEIKIDTSRFSPRDGFYESADYESAANKVEIKVSVGVGSVKIH